MDRISSRLRSQTRISSTLLAGLAGLAVVLSMSAHLSGAVVAPGTVAAENSLRRVQHQAGGIVSELFVADGQTVSAGALLLRLDATMARANLGVITSELGVLSARRQRLQAELSGELDANTLVENASGSLDHSAAADRLAGERRLMTARRNLREGQAEQLRERIRQLQDEGRGAALQIAALRQQKLIAETERADLEPLQRRQLVPRNRITALQREIARFEGSLGELNARSAQTRGRITETELQILQIGSNHLAEVTRDLRDAEARIAELNERRAAAEDQLIRVDVRAPIDGIVHQLATRTVGGVLGAGETAMLLVPDRERLVIEARVNPSDIDEIRHQQAARLRFTSLGGAKTPELNGSVLRVSADLSRDQQTGASYYAVAIEVPETELARLGPAKLMPGMPAETFIVTSMRSIASYLIKPLTDQFQRSMRES